MSIYLYQNPKTGEIRNINQKMDSVHQYFDENGQEWNRLWTIPKMSVDTKGDPFSEKDFLKKTNKNLTIGDIMDESAEMSEKRESKAGKDPVQQKMFNRYKKRTGKPHPLDKPKKIETKDYILEL